MAVVQPVGRRVSGVLALEAFAELMNDLPWRGFLAAFVVVHLPLLAPRFGPYEPATYADLYLQLLLLPFVFVALRWDFGAIEQREQRLFWNYLSLAVCCWWIVRLTYVLIPREQRVAEVHLAIDIVYLLFYIAFLLAAETKPHLRALNAERAPLWAIEKLVLMGLVFTLLVYFVLIPIDITPQSYETWEASLFLYLSLDVLLALRFAQLARECRSRLWRTSYWLLVSTATLWGVLGVLEILWRRGGATWLDAAWTNALWQLPLVLLVLAARLQHRTLPGTDLGIEARQRRSSFLRGGSPLVVAALIVPAIHLGLSLSGRLDDATRAPREWLVLVSIVVLGALMVVERALAQRQSLHQNTYLTALIESSPLPTVLLDPRHRVLTCNPAFEALFLYPFHQIVGNDIDDLITTEGSLREARDITQRVRSGESTFTIGRRHRSDGSPVDVRIFGIPLISDGRLIGIYALYQDITERLAAERTLKESEERFRRLSDAAFEGVILSHQGVIFDANQQAADMFGFTIEEMKGRPIGSRVSKEQKTLVQERSQSGYEQPYELECYRRDRSPFIIEARGKAMPYRGHQARVTVVRDITERKQLEETLRQTQKIEAIGRLTAGIAHDFNNLLTIILGRGEVLMRNLEPAGAHHQWAEEIVEAARRAATMTQQLLAFGRKQPLEVEAVELNKILLAMQKMLSRLLPSNIELRLGLGDDLELVQADPGQLEQVILNLVINSRDAIPDGGIVRLETTRVDVGESERDVVEDLGIEPGCYVCLSVTDTGVGMSSEVLARAFEPFFTTKEKGEGTGLGLATAYGIVKQSGGGIVVQSTLGRGTAMRVYLPHVERIDPDIHPKQTCQESA